MKSYIDNPTKPFRFFIAWNVRPSILQHFDYAALWIVARFNWGAITSTQFFLIDKGILQWCVKGITIFCFCVKNSVKAVSNSTNSLWCLCDKIGESAWNFAKSMVWLMYRDNVCYWLEKIIFLYLTVFSADSKMALSIFYQFWCVLLMIQNG